MPVHSVSVVSINVNFGCPASQLQSDWNKAAAAEMVGRLQTRVGDTGSTPVQGQFQFHPTRTSATVTVACSPSVGALTVRIQYLTEHMKRNKKVLTV